MQVLVELDDDLVAQVDRLAGPGDRSEFVRIAVQRAVRQEVRWLAIEAAAGAIDHDGHDGNADPAAWVREQRRADTARAG
jgi:Arc/MetJ family transcription regulator